MAFTTTSSTSEVAEIPKKSMETITSIVHDEVIKAKCHYLQTKLDNFIYNFHNNAHVKVSLTCNGKEFFPVLLVSFRLLCMIRHQVKPLSFSKENKHLKIG